MNGITLAFSITDLHSSTMNKKSRRPSSAKAKRDKRTTRPLPGGTKTSPEPSVRSDLSDPDQMRGPDPKDTISAKTVGTPIRTESSLHAAMDW